MSTPASELEAIRAHLHKPVKPVIHEPMALWWDSMSYSARHALLKYTDLDGDTQASVVRKRWKSLDHQLRQRIVVGYKKYRAGVGL